MGKKFERASDFITVHFTFCQKTQNDEFGDTSHESWVSIGHRAYTLWDEVSYENNSSPESS